MYNKNPLPFGIYEQILNKAISKSLEANSADEIQLEPIDTEEASKVLSKYIAEVIEKGLANIKDNGGDLTSQIQLCNDLIQQVINTTQRSFYNDLSVDNQAKLLTAILKRKILPVQ